LEEFGKHVAIAGFKNVEILNVEKFLETIRTRLKADVEFQLFDAKFVATWQHLYFATLNALTAFKNKENISKSLAMETMLYASAQHQIRRAMEIIGIKPSSSEIAVLIVGEDAKDVESALSSIAEIVHAKRDDRVLVLSEEKIKAIRKAFEISDVEIEAVKAKGALKKAIVDLVIERGALLAAQR
jgi:tRNA threonylcarbamoyladenosine modification (KEOPS) complex Cgi121 subunit